MCFLLCQNIVIDEITEMELLLTRTCVSKFEGINHTHFPNIVSTQIFRMNEGCKTGGIRRMEKDKKKCCGSDIMADKR